MNQELSMHPAAVVARERALEHQRQLADELTLKQATLDELVDDYRLKFVDITPSPKRVTNGMTIAYNGTRVLRVSTAIRNPKDPYSRLEGRLTAALAFDNGNWVYLRKPSRIKVVDFLRLTFGI